MARFPALVQQPQFTNAKKPENAFHKRHFRAFSQFRPITPKKGKSATTNLGIWS